MNEWITINLPWNHSFDLVDDLLELSKKDQDAIKKREIEKFGCEPSENNQPDGCPDLMKYSDDNNGYKKYEKDMRKYKKSKEWKDYRKLDLEWGEWYNKQPEVIALQEKQEKHNEKVKASSFCGRGLNRPGVLIETEEGKQYLIGDINLNGGVCDDCVAFDNKTIIKRYKIIYEK